MGIIGIKLSNPLRINSRCTGRHREDARNVHNTAIRRALSPLRPCESVTADVHGCPRGVAPLRNPLAIRDNPVTHTGGETTQSLHMPRDARPAHLSSFRLLAMASPQLDAHRKLLIGQHTSGIVRGVDSRSTARKQAKLTEMRGLRSVTTIPLSSPPL